MKMKGSWYYISFMHGYSFSFIKTRINSWPDGIAIFNIYLTNIQYIFNVYSMNIYKKERERETESEHKREKKSKHSLRYLLDCCIM